MKKLFLSLLPLLSAFMLADSPATAQNNYLWRWGYTVSTKDSMGPVNIITPKGKWLSITAGDAGGAHGGGVLEDGTIRNWGGVRLPGQPIGGTSQYGSDTDWQQYAQTSEGAIALRKDGTLWSWCHGDCYGEEFVLGRGRKPGSDMEQIGSDNDWVAIEAGRNLVVALKKDGTLWGWGRWGLLGSEAKYEPTQVGTDSDWNKLGYGTASLAIKKDGSLWELTFSATPRVEQIGTDTDWETGTSHQNLSYLAIKKDGSLWAWGSNTKGQLGDGSTTRIGTPMQIGTDKNWKMVSIGENFTVALKTDSTLWSWGNGSDAMGHQDKTQLLSPTKVDDGGPDDWILVRAGKNHTAGIRASGKDGDGTDPGDGGTGITQHQESTGFTLYPNPVKYQLMVTQLPEKPATVIITDLTGKRIFQTRAEGKEIQINTSGFANGIYIIQAIYDGAVVQKKFVVRE